MLWCLPLSDVAGVVKSVTAHGQSNTFLFLFVRFLIADYFAVSDISVRRDASEFYEETCISTGDVSNALEEASAFIAKTAFPKGLETGILHECHVFHFFSHDGVDDGVVLVFLRPMVGSQGDGHVRSVHAAEVVLGQVAWR
jgi:hypothetical protein